MAPRVRSGDSNEQIRVAGDRIESPAKQKTRYVVKKWIEGELVPMARYGEDPQRLWELCEALGGDIEVEDLVTGEVILKERFG